MSVSVNDRHFNVQENVTLNVVRYVEETVHEPEQGCDPSHRGTLFVEDLYCGQRHDRGYTWTGFTKNAGAAGTAEVTLTADRKPPYPQTGNRNRICGVSRGVCGPKPSLYDTSVKSEGGNVYQWVNVYPVDH